MKLAIAASIGSHDNEPITLSSEDEYLPMDNMSIFNRIKAIKIAEPTIDPIRIQIRFPGIFFYQPQMEPK